MVCGIIQLLKHAGTEGVYQYTTDLMGLRGGTALSSQRAKVDTRLRSITTPLHIPAWRKHLQKHPDKDYVHYILQGIEHGFNIGVDQDRAFKAAHANMQSARQNPHVVEDYLSKEVAEGNMLPIMSAPAVPWESFPRNTGRTSGES